MKSDFGKKLLFFLTFSILGLFLFPKVALAVQYPSSYCNPLQAYPYLDAGSNRGDIGVREPWGVTSADTIIWGRPSWSTPSDLLESDPDRVMKINYGENSTWYPLSRYTQNVWHRYSKVGNYTISWFWGNTRTGNYLICSTTAKIYQPEAKSGEYSLSKPGQQSVTFTPFSGKLGGIYFVTDNYLTSVYEQYPYPCSWFKQSIVGDASHSYTDDTCWGRNGLSWLVNLSSGVSNVSFSIQPSSSGQSKEPFGEKIKNVVLYTRPISVTSYRPTITPPSGFSSQSCYIKDGIRYCCYYQGLIRVCKSITVPPPKLE